MTDSSSLTAGCARQIVCPKGFAFLRSPKHNGVVGVTIYMTYKAMFGYKTSQSYHGKLYDSTLVPLNRTDATVRCVIIVHTQRLLIMLFSLLAQLFAS
jgi:hypothetical protein